MITMADLFAMAVGGFLGFVLCWLFFLVRRQIEKERQRTRVARATSVSPVWIGEQVARETKRQLNAMGRDFLAERDKLFPIMKAKVGTDWWNQADPFSSMQELHRRVADVLGTPTRVLNWIGCQTIDNIEKEE